MVARLPPTPGTRKARNTCVGLLPHLHVVDAHHLAVQVAQRTARVALRKRAMEGQSQKQIKGVAEGLCTLHGEKQQ